MKAAFDMFCIVPVEALLALDLMSIIEANTNCIAYGQDSIDVAFEFYGNSKEDMYEGCTKISPLLLNCAKESFRLEYAGYKIYVCTCRLELAYKISGLEKNIKSCLALTEANKYKSQKTIKEIQRELLVTQKKQQSPLTVNDLLGDSVIEAVVPNIRKLLLLYLLVPLSEAVIERGFSCMKTIMTDKRANLDSESLEPLMCLSHRNKSFSAEYVRVKRTA